MQIKVQKWGNSLAVRIPKALAAQAAVIENSLLEVSVEKRTIALKPARKRPLRLRDLVNRITKENMHHEYDWGKPLGQEIW